MMNENKVTRRITTPIFYVVLFFLLLLQCNTESSGNENSKQVIDNKFDFTSIDKLINNSIIDSAFPGAVLLVGNSDSIIYNNRFGNFTYDEYSTQASLSTIYDIASLTKVIATTTAIMLLFDRGLISLDDKVGKYLPQFGVSGKENVTIRNLLKHNSGLPAWKKFYPNTINKEDVLDEIFRLKLEFRPGTKTLYSDLGFIILGIIVEKVSDMNLDEFCDKEIFKPLQMNNTFYNPDKELKNKIAPTELDNYWRNRLLQGEVHDETASIMNGVAGHAGLFSTAEDIYKLVSVLLNDGMNNGQQFISSKTVKTFLSREEKSDTRLLGWDAKSETGSSAGKYFGKNSYGHLGFTGTSVWTDPEKNLIVVFLTNRVYPTRENKKLIKIRPELHDLIFKTISLN